MFGVFKWIRSFLKTFKINQVGTLNTSWLKMFLIKKTYYRYYILEKQYCLLVRRYFYRPLRILVMTQSWTPDAIGIRLILIYLLLHFERTNFA